MQRLYAPLPQEGPAVIELASTMDKEDAVCMLYTNANAVTRYNFIPCRFVLTLYRIIVFPNNGATHIEIPLFAIKDIVMQKASAKVEKSFFRAVQNQVSGYKHNGQHLFSVLLRTGHVWNYELVFRSIRALHCIAKVLPKNNVSVEGYPAFSIAALQERPQKNAASTDADTVDLNTENANTKDTYADAPFDDGVDFGWNIYNVEEEFMTRQMAGSAADGEDDWQKHFRIVTLPKVNGDYTRIPSYPTQLVLPVGITDASLVECIPLREEGRVPVVTFVHREAGAVLARSGQPLLFATNSKKDVDLCRCFSTCMCASHPSGAAAQANTTTYSSLYQLDDDDDDDDRILQPVAPVNKGSGRLFVVDCRPKSVVAGNSCAGGGCEWPLRYEFCATNFFEIDNIHGLSSSFAKFRALVTSYDGDAPTFKFLSELESTKWLEIIQYILICGNTIAEHLDSGRSCLVHCTSGWDRTPQCCAVALLLLDPFHRTIFGFCVLIEKEFGSFGHRFAERCGHQASLRRSTTSQQQAGAASPEAQKLCESPVFLQFLDVVFQMVRQFPHCFEFTPALLEYLSEEVSSCHTGTFLCNSEQERELEGVRLRCPSVWTYVLRAAAAEKDGQQALRFVNSTYDAATAWAHIAARRMQRLSLCCSSKRIVFWESLYLKRDSDNYRATAAPPPPAAPPRRLSWGEPFDAYQRQQLRAACEARQRELEQLRELEKTMALRRDRMAGLFSQSGSAFCNVDDQVCSVCFCTFAGWADRQHVCACCRHKLCSGCKAKHICEKSSRSM